jgi:16S rRNA (adenine1518-N6/adenine1519-N6)-dimethyltransferase
LLKKYNIRPKKGLGQNYLIAQPTMSKIVDALGATSKDTVLEIGCGLGVMTAMIAERCKRVIAVDADASSLEIARAEFGERGNIKWIHGDILETHISSYARSGKLVVVGNIPYNISSPILFHLLDHRGRIDRAVIMIQKEVADRVVAKPGGKVYGALSVMLQSYAVCRRLFNVARTNFVPPPKVVSSVIQLGFSEEVAVPSFHMLQAVVQAAFQQRRKMLRNALLGSSDLNVTSEQLDMIFEELDRNRRPATKPLAGRRPETLSVHEYHLLAAAIKFV